jgi:hypothetical protein
LVVFGLLGAVFSVGPASAQDFNVFGTSGGFGIFDEVRVGTVFSVQDNDDSGVIASGQLFFRSFVPPFENYLANTLLRPRLHLGGNFATADDGISQAFAGLTWNFPIAGIFFLEASFGGTVHDGAFSSSTGPDLGCRFLFHERVGIGVDIGRHWRVVASADHSSHASLCNGGNSGLTHAGIYAGYVF